MKEKNYVEQKLIKEISELLKKYEDENLRKS